MKRKDVLREKRTCGWMKKDGDDGDVKRECGKSIQSWVGLGRWRWDGRGSLESDHWEQEKEKHHKEKRVSCSNLDDPSSLADPFLDIPFVVAVSVVVGGDGSPIERPWKSRKGHS